MPRWACACVQSDLQRRYEDVLAHRLPPDGAAGAFAVAATHCGASVSIAPGGLREALAPLLFAVDVVVGRDILDQLETLREMVVREGIPDDAPSAGGGSVSVRSVCLCSFVRDAWTLRSH